MKLLCTGIMILGCATQAAYSEEPVSLDQLTVTARPVGLQSLEHTAQAITILSDEELKKRQASTIGETLSDIPGVTTNRFSPLASRPIIRGLGGTRVLILENGISSSDVSTISVDHAVTIEPIQAEQIEIFRGPSTLLYGSAASGGLVNVVTNHIPEYVPERLNTKLFSSYNTNSLEKLFSFKTEGGLNNIAFHFDATKRDAKDYEAKNGQIKNSFYETKIFNIGSSYIDNRGFLGLSFGRFESTHGVPLNPEDPTELPFIESQQNRLNLSGQVINPFFGIKTINLQAGYSDYQHVEFEDATTAGTIFNNEQLDSRIEIQHAPLGNLNGTIGVQFGYQNINAVGDEAFIPKTRAKNVAVFILEETDINDALHFEIGGRYEYQNSDPDNAAEVSNDLYSVSSGLHWHFIEDTAFSINISRSQRAAAAEELFANGPHVATGTFEIGQSELNVETANNIDLSLAHEHGSWQWNLSVFVNYIEDFIFLQGLDRDNDGIVDRVDSTGAAIGEFLLVQYQQDNAIFYGFEAAMNINLYTGKNGQLNLNLFGDYVSAERENGDKLSRLSPARIGTGIDYNYHKFTVGIDLTNTLAQKDNAPLETDTGGYSILNINAGYNIFPGEKNLSVFFKATNLLEEVGQRHTSFIKDRAPIMGRALMFGFQAGF